MKNILLPTDFSGNSWNAIHYAIQLYENEPCVFHLFNAYTPVIYDLSYMLLDSPAQLGLRDPVRAASKENLEVIEKRILETVGTNPNHRFETVARFDTLVSGIKSILKERPIDLIVMGTKGATGALQILFGSNTVQVFKEVRCPIMAIPSNFSYVPPKEVLFPTDLEVHFNTQQLQVLLDVAASHQATVNAMHVRTGYGLREVQVQNQLILQSLFQENGYQFHEVEDMDIPDAIGKFQEKHPINLLAMINNKHSFFENILFKDTINQIGFYLNIPFLVIPSINHKTMIS